MSNTNDFGFKELEIGKTYSKWIFSILNPFIGKRIMEAGCGVGLMIENYLNKEFIIACDINDNYIEVVKKRYVKIDKVNFLKLNIENLSKQEIKSLIKIKLDTIISINVLEHIKNDRQAIVNFYKILPSQGHLLIFVPALPQIYGTIDEGFGHYRRYTKKEIELKIQEAGFKIREIRYFNFIGIFWWFIMGKIIKQKNLPKATGFLLKMIVPLIQNIESIISIPVGQSLIVVAEK